MRLPDGSSRSVPLSAAPEEMAKQSIPREDEMLRVTVLALAIVGLMLLSGAGRSWAQENTMYGSGALASDTSGGYNSAFGYDVLFRNTTGGDNTAIGDRALYSNNIGYDNTAIGDRALFSNNTGDENTASGTAALFSNSTGSDNTATGQGALRANTEGGENTAIGAGALFANTTGSDNTASGEQALYSNTTGPDNTASGREALYSNTMGFDNTASGHQALQGNTTGSYNTGVGVGAGSDNTTGTKNTFIGYDADANADDYKNGTAIGDGATLTASNSIVLGNTGITKIYAKVTSITAISDRRRKKDIAALDPALGLDFIEKLQPVSYRFKDGDETQRYGFIAQDLEQALPARLQDKVEHAKPEHGVALIERQNDAARTYRVAYGELTAPMVKAIQEQQAEIAALRQTVETLKKQIGAMKLAQNSAPAQ
jgi:trimeric autotransporter adhesin